MSGRAMEWALETCLAKGWTGSRRDVLLVLAYHANRKTGEAWPSVDTLMEESGHTRSTVFAALAEYRPILDHVRRPGWTTIWRFPPTARNPQPGYPQPVRPTGREGSEGSGGPDKGVRWAGLGGPVERTQTREEQGSNPRERPYWTDERGYVYVGPES